MNGGVFPQAVIVKRIENMKCEECKKTIMPKKGVYLMETAPGFGRQYYHRACYIDLLSKLMGKPWGVEGRT